jgi:hypothetical protein
MNAYATATICNVAICAAIAVAVVILESGWPLLALMFLMSASTRPPEAKLPESETR